MVSKTNYLHINIDKGVAKIEDKLSINPLYNYGDITLDNWTISDDKKLITGDQLEFRIDIYREIPNEELDEKSFHMGRHWLFWTKKKRKLAWVLLKKRTAVNLEKPTGFTIVNYDYIGDDGDGGE